jgi:branched-chain amino acid transport system permease protein
VVESVLIGLGLGSVYGLIALGYNVVFRTSGVFNFAQGQLLMIGSMAAFSFTMTYHLAPGWAAVSIALIIGFLGVVVERITVFPLAGDLSGLWIITTLSAGTILTSVAINIWGTIPQYVKPYLGKGSILIFGTYVQTSFLLAFGAIIVFVAVLELVERLTYTGRVLRAIAINREAAQLAGIPVQRYQAIAFFVGGVVAGIGGFLLAPVTYASVYSGQELGLTAFACWVVGGIGSSRGLVLGSWIVGIIETYVTTRFGSQYADISVFVTLLLVLAIRPNGILGRVTVRRV